MTETGQVSILGPFSLPFFFRVYFYEEKEGLTGRRCPHGISVLFLDFSFSLLFVQTRAWGRKVVGTMIQDEVRAGYLSFLFFRRETSRQTGFEVPDEPWYDGVKTAKKESKKKGEEGEKRVRRWERKVRWVAGYLYIFYFLRSSLPLDWPGQRHSESGIPRMRMRNGLTFYCSTRGQFFPFVCIS